MNNNNCPVCNQHTFNSPDNYDICPICGWENDGLQREKPNYWGGANTLSVNESKKVFKLLKNNLLSAAVKNLLNEYQERDKKIYQKYFKLNLNDGRQIEELKKSHELFILKLNELG